MPVRASEPVQVLVQVLVLAPALERVMVQATGLVKVPEQVLGPGCHLSMLKDSVRVQETVMAQVMRWVRGQAPRHPDY